MSADEKRAERTRALARRAAAFALRGELPWPTALTYTVCQIAGGVLAAALAITFMNQISEKVFAATSVKGRTRAAMTRELLEASDSGRCGAAPESCTSRRRWGMARSSVPRRCSPTTTTPGR